MVENGRFIVREETESTPQPEDSLTEEKIPLRGANHTHVSSKGRKRSEKIRGDQDGSMFKATKAKGDMKKGRLQPYAYIKLDPRLLSKKKQNQALGKFNNLIGAAKKGAREGAKRRRN